MDKLTSVWAPTDSYACQARLVLHTDRILKGVSETPFMNTQKMCVAPS